MHACMWWIRCAGRGRGPAGGGPMHASGARAFLPAAGRVRLWAHLWLSPGRPELCTWRQSHKQKLRGAVTLAGRRASHTTMTTKDLESGDAGSSSDGSRLAPSPKKGLKQSLSRAFLSSGLQVTFKARRWATHWMQAGRGSPSAAPRACATHFAGRGRRRKRAPGARVPNRSPFSACFPYRTSPTPWSTLRTRRRS